MWFGGLQVSCHWFAPAGVGIVGSMQKPCVCCNFKQRPVCRTGKIFFGFCRTVGSACLLDRQAAVTTGNPTNGITAPHKQEQHPKPARESGSMLNGDWYAILRIQLATAQGALILGTGIRTKRNTTRSRNDLKYVAPKTTVDGSSVFSTRIERKGQSWQR